MTKTPHFRNAKSGSVQMKTSVLFKKLNSSADVRTEDCLAIIQKYIDEHYYECIEINDLVKLSRLNTSLFYYKFKKHTGFTPLQYITHKRINKAKHLLLSTSMKIYDVAHAVGYKDSYYFSRMFKRMVGVSPQKFKHLKIRETKSRVRS
ncbi:helix-turn-helix domain-containing protein [Alteribacillus iranensis]|uniref:Two-component system, response regulator YesN n=1 Tax=Alteribacillus iranensis TaxID=930128 RepID=A0A1I2F5K1_9BACI|nr:AraC family transcriptional regulator [Alteribacillus iranensis]SFF00249.1 two-component system, response regulator YesN [Alteribacillus iranensis]